MLDGSVTIQIDTKLTNGCPPLQVVHGSCVGLCHTNAVDRLQGNCRLQPSTEDLGVDRHCGARLHSRVDFVGLSSYRLVELWPKCHHMLCWYSHWKGVQGGRRCCGHSCPSHGNFDMVVVLSAQRRGWWAVLGPSDTVRVKTPQRGYAYWS